MSPGGAACPLISSPQSGRYAGAQHVHVWRSHPGEAALPEQLLVADTECQQ